jgi:lactate dehydrogenase-like 2-hydroxyacid dehydrogenase
VKPNVLVTKQIFPETIRFLEQHATVDYEMNDEGLAPEELLARAAGNRVILSQITDAFSRDVLARLPALGIGMIAHMGVGYDNIDVPAATEYGILVSNTPGVLDDTTADLAFALLMAAARRLAEAHAFVHSGEWKRFSMALMIGVDIHNRTLGILGMGRIGQAVARRAAGFSMRVRYHNRTQLDAARERELNAEWVPRERLLTESDFLSIHLPLNPATRHSIGENELRQMKKTTILVNTARGPIVDEAALAKALRERWIAGAGLDVFEREPQVHPELLACSNAVLSPHIGSATVETRLKVTMMAAENAVAALSGRCPPNLLNPAAWEKSAFRLKAAGSAGPTVER